MNLWIKSSKGGHRRRDWRSSKNGGRLISIRKRTCSKWICRLQHSMISAKLHLPFRFLKLLTLQWQASKSRDKIVKKAPSVFTHKHSYPTLANLQITLFTLGITLIRTEISFSVDSNRRNSVRSWFWTPSSKEEGIHRNHIINLVHFCQHTRRMNRIISSQNNSTILEKSEKRRATLFRIPRN